MPSARHPRASLDIVVANNTTLDGDAADESLRGVTEASPGSLRNVIFCCFDQRAARWHEAALTDIDRE